LLELLGLNDAIQIAPVQPTGVSPTLFGANYVLKGFLLPFAEPDEFLLHLLLSFVQIGIQGRLADDAQLHFMTTPGFFVDGHVVKILGCHLNRDQIPFLENAAVEVFEDRKGEPAGVFQSLRPQANCRSPQGNRSRCQGR